jgi:hypothetical protein
MHRRSVYHPGYGRSCEHVARWTFHRALLAFLKVAAYIVRSAFPLCNDRHRVIRKPTIIYHE